MFPNAEVVPSQVRNPRMGSIEVSAAVRVGALAVVLCLQALSAGAETSPEPPTYPLTVWAAENGEPPGDVFAIAQDVEGFLWLGGPTGLLRFDGARFTRWPPAGDAGSLPSGPVHAIVGAPDGSIWVGFGGGGGVARIEKDRIVRFAGQEGAPTDVAAMIRDRQGAIWVATRRGLFRFFGGRWTVIGEEDGYPGAETLSLFEDRAGRLWAGTAAGIYRRTDGSFELVDETVRTVQSFAEDEQGGIWITDPNHLAYRLFTRERPRPDPAVQLPAGGWRLLHDRRGQIWIAAFGGGLLRIADATAPLPVIERFAYEHRLAGSPRALYQDAEDNIWLGMRGGLLRLSGNSFTTTPLLEGLTNDGVRTSAVGRDGSVWVATGHAVNRFLHGSHTAYGVSQTTALHVDRQDRLWISAAGEIGQFVNGRLAPLAVPDVTRVMAMTTDSRGVLWLCSSLRGVMTWDGKTLSRFQPDPQVAALACQSIYTDRQDRVWIGFLSGGAAVYERGRLQRFGEGDGLARGTVLGILEDSSGAVWISTSSGVSRYADGRFTAITQAHAPLVDIVPVLVEDDEGYLWVGVNSGAGILRFHPGEMDKVVANPADQIEYALFDESDGLQTGSQTWQSGVGGVRDGAGRLWVAAGVGMAIVDPQKLPSPRRPGPTRIESVTADGRRIVPVPDLALPSGTSTLEIEYGAISLSSASKLRFRYMLEGVDAGWVYAGVAREARYANVPSGGHRFRVSVTDNGRWTEAATWAFSVQPPLYLTRGFLGLAAAGLLLLLAAVWWVRLRAVRHQYALVFAERARVSREIHDTLLQSLAAIGMELETIASHLDPSQNPARDALRRLRRHVGHSVREARESILELRHNPMRRPELAVSLRDLAASTTRAKGMPTEFSVTGRPQKGVADVDIQLLRIAQEAVNNAVRHAHPSQIRIGLAYEPARLVLTVTDDGRGFTPTAFDSAPTSGEHLGLLTMKERAARVRGHIAIESSPGSGTTVSVTAPLTRRPVGVEP